MTARAATAVLLTAAAALTAQAGEMHRKLGARYRYSWFQHYFIIYATSDHENIL